MARLEHGEKRSISQAPIPSTSFHDGILSVPGYTFDKATSWADTGSMTILAEGVNLRVGSAVLAKIAPARTQGSVILEREAHLLESTKQAGEAATVVLNFIDFITIPRVSGDCVVLLVEHPGSNQLAQYFPSARVNPFLLADAKSRPTTAAQNADYMSISDDGSVSSFEFENSDVMDLSSFLEFTIQATHCLQMLHQMGIIHREVRANAFHLAAQSGRVRLVHFGNRSESFEHSGGPTELLMKSSALDEIQQLKIKEALCYLAPEQTGQSPDGVNIEDHRTDLYALGVFFWSLLVGRGALPFEGSPMEILHNIALKRPSPVHEIRRDVPQVLASIIDKLIAKSADHRYQSCHGLKCDLIEAQRLLLASVHTGLGQISELIPPFPVGHMDRYMHFSLPGTLFGREKEVEMIRSVIVGSHATGLGLLPAAISLIDDDKTPMMIDDKSDYMNSSVRTHSQYSQTPPTPVQDDASLTRYTAPSVSSPSSEVSLMFPPGASQSDGLRRAAIVATGVRSRKVHSIVVFGPPGAGKSSLVLSQTARWRAYGLWGQAKCQRTEVAPFAALMACLSSMLRQLMVFNSDLHRFVTKLRSELGPQMQNIPLLYQGVPELKYILSMFDVELDSPHESLPTDQLRARFQSVVVTIFSVLAETRVSALFLDDLHEADESLLDMLHTLANSKCHMIIFCTLRKQEVALRRAQATFSSHSRTTWIELEDGLSLSAISPMISKTLHRSRDECAQLSQLVHSISRGNAFSARSFLMALYRQKFIQYNWEHNHYHFNIEAIKTSLIEHKDSTDPTDPQFLLSQLRALHEDARRFLVWASLFGATFKVAEVGFMMHWEDSTTGAQGDNNADFSKAFREHASMQTNSGRESMHGLQVALQEGWLVQRGRELCSFSHDRYHQAARDLAKAEWPVAKMSYRIIVSLLSDPTTIDAHRVADQATKCFPLLRVSEEKDIVVDLLFHAAESSWTRGAHENALKSFESIRYLLDEDHWNRDPELSLKVFLRLAELNLWSVNYSSSIALVEECLIHAKLGEDKARLLWIRSRVYWARNEFGLALEDTLTALAFLDCPIDPRPSADDLDIVFETTRTQIMSIGMENIISLPRSNSDRIDLIACLLVEGSTHAYWIDSHSRLLEFLGWKTVQLGLSSGTSPSTGVGFLYAIAFLADRRGLHRFCATLAHLALDLSQRFGTNQDRCRCAVLFCSFAAGFDSAHYATNGPRLLEAVKYGYASGDRPFTIFTLVDSIMLRLFAFDHLSDLLIAAEEVMNDVKLWTQASSTVFFAQGLVSSVRALGGLSLNIDAKSVFDTSTFSERDFLEERHFKSDSVGGNLYNAFKVFTLYSLGYIKQAVELGFEVYDTRSRNPGHRHNRFALFFHTLALIEWLRFNKEGTTNPENIDIRARYTHQIDLNYEYIACWASASPINAGAWIALIDAEVASLNANPAAFQLYDLAVTNATEHGWPLEEAWALYLEGCHYVRAGVVGLGAELQKRGIARFSQRGAQAIVERLSHNVRGGVADLSCHYRAEATSEMAVQTVAAGSYGSTADDGEWREKPSQEKLSADDLAAILRWSSDISRDINLSNALRRLTEVVTERSGAQFGCVVIAQESGDYAVATTMVPPNACQLHDNMQKSIRNLDDPLQQAVIRHTLNLKEAYVTGNASEDARFASESAISPHSSVVCLPIHGNRGQTHGVVYLASEYSSAFASGNIVTILTLLCEQVSISIANALLFRSVQVGTRENLKMIASQKEALDQARKHREEAEKATSAKSNFLASMSHELRTPFSAFYGLLDLLDSDQELTESQREIVQTAKQSCELLLKIIDGILDYSKLEASAVTLEFSGFLVETIVADCVELLLPSAAKRLDLSYDIAPDVPAWIKSDYSRIRQVLVNLCGNALKFIPVAAPEDGSARRNSVSVRCQLDETQPAKDGEDVVMLRFSVQDTGIGMTQEGCDSLFRPFQQLESGTTRRFGGTGLGLSISRQIVTLMGGAIGVTSELGKGSTFWFTIPAQRFVAPEAERHATEMRELRTRLGRAGPPRVLAISASPTTHSLLTHLLSGFAVTCVPGLAAGLEFVRVRPPALEFVLLDDQSDAHAAELAEALRTAGHTAAVVHLYTPTTGLGAGHVASGGGAAASVARLTKPPRQARLLHTLARLKNVDTAPAPAPGNSSGATADETPRTLYGEVLIAEDNAVAQRLLVKQLERVGLKVTATSNGQEAIDQWEAHPPGFFALALFDHHMPICDGVEAARRIRQAEEQRAVHTSLPIVALSADAQESTKKMCLSNGFTAFFSKPLKKQDMAVLLSSFGTGSRPSTPP